MHISFSTAIETALDQAPRGGHQVAQPTLICGEEVDETLEEWDRRMEAAGSRPPKGPAIDWVVDQQGKHLVKRQPETA